MCDNKTINANDTKVAGIEMAMTVSRYKLSLR